MYPLVMFTRKVSNSNVLLPKTKFPLRVNASKRKDRDLWIMKTASFDHLYKWQRQNMQHETEFVLHDGPPYANGKPHMGHAMNKILKDFIIRYKMLSGKQVNFVPGWDCHGLPIELKALEATNISQSDVLDIRNRAKSFALDTIKIQKSAFCRWGVMADWDTGCYFTFSPSYVISQLRLFCDLHEKGLIYRDYKPVYWSPSSRTALAESELEYNTEHVSPSVYLKLEMKSPFPESFPIKNSPVYLVIWTTTPWTLPANQALCFHPEKTYCLVLCESGMHQEYLVIASELCASLEQLWSCKFTVINEFSGNALKGHFYVHPIKKTELMPLLPGYHVTMKKGTGLVHTAPAHGPDDFLVALQHKLSIVNLVDDKGWYSTEAGEILNGLSVLDEGQKTVLRFLKNDIIFQEDFKHSYPYDWRTKKPVILRASLQWFIDTDKIKQQAIDAMKNVAVIPANFEKPMLNQLAQRPYWCISRQRSWGVPIPVIYQSENPMGNDTTIVHRDIINRLCDLTVKKGVDQWWILRPEELIGNELMQKLNLTPGHIYKGMDIMDIWFDSGVSWNAVLPQGKQADLYLEGVDQFGGWFQSSLLTSVASTGRAPYKSIFVHGFTLDKQGRKMSKSEGNVIDPTTVIDGDGKEQQAVGIDVLRWWTACHVSGNGSSVSVSPQSIQQASEDVQKLRSVLRFLLGNIDGVTYDRLEKLNISSFRLTDRYMLHLLSEFVAAALLAYQEMNFRKVTSLVLHFINSSVSAFYCSILKDRLYCQGSTSENRLSALFVLSEILDHVTLIIAPIVPHLTEEVEVYHPWHSDKGGLFRNRRYASVKDFDAPAVVEWMKPSLELRNTVNKAIGCLNTQEWDVRIVVSDSEDLKVLQKLQHEERSHDSALCELLQVSMVTLLSKQDLVTKADEEAILHEDERKKLELVLSGLIEITVSKTNLLVCPRCRRNTSSNGEICYLCSKTLSTEKITLP